MQEEVNISELFSPDILEEFQVVICHPTGHLLPPENPGHTHQAPSHVHNRKWRPTIYLCPNTQAPCCGQGLDQKVLDRFQRGRL